VQQFEVLVAANRGVVFSTVTRALLHELRTPTQALALAGEMIARDGAVLTDSVRRALGGHARQLRPLLDLIARAQQRPAGNDPGPVALGDLVDLLQTTHRGLPGSAVFDTSGLNVSHLPALKASGPALGHVLLNLMMNAFESNAPSVRLSACVRQADTTVEITVDDDGPGVAPAVRDRLFEPFVTTKNTAVAGLGLAVARHLVTPWGGTIVHVPTPAGARFVLTLDVW
jgi:signal transduction histidine kinase